MTCDDFDFGERFKENVAKARIERESKVKGFTYEYIPNGDNGPHFRIADSNDDRVATCYSESNAKLVVRLMNAGLAAQ